ncbi:hypothetical protein CABS01_16395 [Colletotrichum abscissum]|uniref:uncharacterized protein n=1 Tax=Colletotrichum abscissum TaxID=1671311 RepID=UPI0027D6CB67|nr:uncharacterized protein CABS01_16395 [Colletotrichum abscissum]KAK1471309.1 hypothetical protein CABS01_16395 [Colletotrichum abscissum]
MAGTGALSWSSWLRTNCGGACSLQRPLADQDRAAICVTRCGGAAQVNSLQSSNACSPRLSGHGKTDA